MRPRPGADRSQLAPAPPAGEPQTTGQPTGGHGHARPPEVPGQRHHDQVQRDRAAPPPRRRRGAAARGRRRPAGTTSGGGSVPPGARATVRPRGGSSRSPARRSVHARARPTPMAARPGRGDDAAVSARPAMVDGGVGKRYGRAGPGRQARVDLPGEVHHQGGRLAPGCPRIGGLRQHEDRDPAPPEGRADLPVLRALADERHDVGHVLQAHERPSRDVVRVASWRPAPRPRTRRTGTRVTLTAAGQARCRRWPTPAPRCATGCSGRPSPRDRCRPRAAARPGRPPWPLAPSPKRVPGSPAGRPSARWPSDRSVRGSCRRAARRPARSDGWRRRAAVVSGASAADVDREQGGEDVLPAGEGHEGHRGALRVGAVLDEPASQRQLGHARSGHQAGDVDLGRRANISRTSMPARNGDGLELPAGRGGGRRFA